MAIESLSILTQNGGGHALLAVAYGPVIENIQKGTLSSGLKNQELSGDPMAGTFMARKLVNATVNPYGTARSGGAGTQVRAVDVPVNLDQHIEIIEEISENDVRTFGVQGLIERRAANHQKRLTKKFERDFWFKACLNGTKITPSVGANTLDKKVDEIIVALESTKSDFVDGVDRDMMTLVLTSAKYTELQEKIDTLPGEGGKSYQVFHNIPVKISTDLPTGVDAVIIVTGVVAQPIRLTLDDLGKIPMSNNYHFGIFADYGTEVTNPECIKTLGEPTISFKIGGTSYTARYGSTAAEWVASDYNTASFKIASDKLQTSASKDVLNNGTAVAKTDVLVDGAEYTVSP